MGVGLYDFKQIGFSRQDVDCLCPKSASAHSVEGVASDGEGV